MEIFVLTSEQEKVIKRARDMLRRAFPKLVGYIRFDMGNNADTVICNVRLKVEK